MDPVGAALSTRVLAMTMTDVRATLVNTQNVQAAAPAQPADVILELSAAAQQLLAAD